MVPEYEDHVWQAPQEEEWASKCPLYSAAAVHPQQLHLSDRTSAAQNQEQGAGTGQFNIYVLFYFSIILFLFFTYFAVTSVPNVLVLIGFAASVLYPFFCMFC